MKFRKESPGILKTIIKIISIQFLILIVLDLVDSSYSDNVLNLYSSITTIDYLTLRDVLNTITDPIKSLLSSYK